MRVFIVAVLLVLAIYGAHQSAASLSYQEAGDAEYNWLGAMTYCDSLGDDVRLPHIWELAGLMYRGVLKQPKTDYWSRTGMFGYAFGVNTKSNVLSFDRFQDIDHVVCVRN